MLGPDGGEPASAGLAEAARRVADEVLAPAAQDTDRADSVPPGHLAALAEAGLFALACPGATAASGRDRLAEEVYEILAGACGVTFFTWVQHHAPVRLLAASSNAPLRDRWLPRLCSGEVLGGVAFAHLRRPGPPAVSVRPSRGGGWILSGEAPWVTSWGLAGVFAVAARHGDQVVFVLVSGNAGDRVRPSAPLRLLAMSASRTVRLRFDDLWVPADDLVVELPFEEWQARDRVATARPNPAAFGVAATAIRLLAELDAAAAEALEAERQACRAAAATAPADLDRLVAVRAWSLELAARAAQALVVASGGRAMLLDHPAQRLLREAAFYAIQAQTPPLRRSLLDRLSLGVQAPQAPQALHGVQATQAPRSP